MAETSGPFDPADPENPVAPGEVLDEANWELMLQELVDGVIGVPGSSAYAASATGTRGVALLAGTALARAHWHRSTATVTKTSPANAAGQTRVDRAVLRLDRTANAITIELKEGTAGAGVPALTDTATTTERPLWRWNITPGATSVSGLTDERQWLGSTPRACTSTNRPISPRVGQLAYEADTGLMILWNGSAWRSPVAYSGEVSIAASVSGWATDVAAVLERDSRTVVVRYGTFERTGGTMSGSSRIPGLIPEPYRHPTREHYAVVVDNHGNSWRATFYPQSHDRRGQIWITQGPDIPKGRFLYGFTVSWIAGAA